MLTTVSVLIALALGQAQPTGPGAPPGAAPGAEGQEAAGEAAAAPEDASRVPTRRYLIERVDLRGLSRTQPEAVRRHLLFDEGEILDPERVLLSRLALLQLGWFSRVETHVERGSERGKLRVVVDLVGRITLIVTDLVIGSTTPQPIYGGLGLSQQNFMGQGLGLSGGFVYGGPARGRGGDPDRYSLRAGFFAPDLWVPHLRLVAGASALFLRGEELTCPDVKCKAFTSGYGKAPRTRYQRAGGEILLGVRPGPFERLSVAYRYERIHATRIGLAPG